MKELHHCSTNEEVIFNQMLRAARNQIECAFGRPKARWSILLRPMDIPVQKLQTWEDLLKRQPMQKDHH